MLKDVKIAFFDLDGTLLNSNREISIKNKSALKLLHDNNVKLVLASGRVDTYVKKYAEELGIIDYILANNGALVYDYHKQEIIYEESFDYNTLKKLWEYANKNSMGMTLNAYGIRYSNSYATTSKDNNQIIDSLDNMNQNIYQVVFSSFNHNKIEQLLTYLEDFNMRISYISKQFYDSKSKTSVSVDLNLQNTSKGNSIEYLLNILNIDNKEALCFGDSDNDISMFNKCGIKIAMENSNEYLKSIADEITSDNNSDGIYEYINKNMV